MLNHNLIIDVIDELFPELTKRECEFLYFYSLVIPVPEISRIMGISINTNKTYKSRIINKLQACGSGDIRLILKLRLDCFFIQKLVTSRGDIPLTAIIR